MNKFGILLVIISVLVLLQIPLHVSATAYQIPGHTEGFPIHRGFVLEIGTVGLGNGTINITVDYNKYTLSANETIEFSNLSGEVYVNSSAGQYLLQITIYPQEFDFWFYLASGSALWGLVF